MRIFLSIILWVVMLVAPVRADSVTLTTYYPSPSGDYANLHVSGNVGVGTSAPSQKLDVNGNIHATGDICTEAGGGKCLSTVAGISEIVTVNEAACGNTDFTLTASCAPGYKLLSCAGGSMAGLMIDFGFFKVSGAYKIIPDTTANACTGYFSFPVCSDPSQTQEVVAVCGR